VRKGAESSTPVLEYGGFIFITISKRDRIEYREGKQLGQTIGTTRKRTNKQGTGRRRHLSDEHPVFGILKGQHRTVYNPHKS